MLPDPGGLQGYLNGNARVDWYEEYSIGGTTFSTVGTPPVKRGRMRHVLGREVSTCEFTILCGSGAPIIATAMSGDWDAAVLVVTRVFNGSIQLERFRGRVSDVRPTANSVQVVGASILSELGRRLPVRTFGSSCPYIYGDAATCGSPGGACEHTIGTCTSGNFGGFPTIPSSVP